MRSRIVGECLDFQSEKPAAARKEQGKLYHLLRVQSAVIDLKVPEAFVEAVIQISDGQALV